MATIGTRFNITPTLVELLIMD